MKIELRNRINEDVVIFYHECEGNSIKKTVEEAVKQGVSLAYANLSGADLSNADLDRAYLYEANLAGADLSNADLAGAFLTEANLAGAKLDKAKLTRAYLSGAKCDESQKDIILKAIGLVFHKGNDLK